MKRREGVKGLCPFCRICSYWMAPAMALAVHEPSCPWSYTGGQPGRMSTEGGGAATAAGAAHTRSRCYGTALIRPAGGPVIVPEVLAARARGRPPGLRHAALLLRGRPHLLLGHVVPS